MCRCVLCSQRSLMGVCILSMLQHTLVPLPLGHHPQMRTSPLLSSFFLSLLSPLTHALSATTLVASGHLASRSNALVFSPGWSDGRRGTWLHLWRLCRGLFPAAASMQAVVAARGGAARMILSPRTQPSFHACKQQQPLLHTTAYASSGQWGSLGARLAAEEEDKTIRTKAGRTDL